MRYLEKAKGVTVWLPCLIALLWIFGKRISENLALYREDLRLEKGYLYVKFTVLKKKSRKAEPVPKVYLKKINTKHKGVPYITEYINKIETGPLFPNLSRELARYYFRKVTTKAWFHLFRESLATQMAEHEATEEQLLHWFDWQRVETAHRYVKRGTRLIKKFADRDF